MTKLDGQLKSTSFKFVTNYFSFDIAEYEYDKQVAFSTPKFKEKC
jgi:hypothetical protein